MWGRDVATEYCWAVLLQKEQVMASPKDWSKATGQWSLWDSQMLGIRITYLPSLYYYRWLYEVCTTQWPKVALFSPFIFYLCFPRFSLSLSTENSEGEKGSLLVYLVASAVFFWQKGVPKFAFFLLRETREIVVDISTFFILLFSVEKLKYILHLATLPYPFVFFPSSPPAASPAPYQLPSYPRQTCWFLVSEKIFG